MKETVVKKIEELVSKYSHVGDLLQEIDSWSKKDLDSFFKNELEIPLKENKDIQIWTLNSIIREVVLKQESSNPYLILFK